MTAASEADVGTGQLHACVAHAKMMAAAKKLQTASEASSLKWQTYLESQWPRIMGYFLLILGFFGLVPCCFGLLWGIVAHYFGLLGFPGSANQPQHIQERRCRLPWGLRCNTLPGCTNLRSPCLRSSLHRSLSLSLSLSLCLPLYIYICLDGPVSP